MHRLRKLTRKPLFWWALAIAVVAGVAFAVWPREPRYEGKPLSYWLDHLPSLMVETNGRELRLFTPRRAYLQLQQDSRVISALQATEVAPKAVNTLNDAALPVLLKRLKRRNTRLSHAEACLRQWTWKLNLWQPPPILLYPEMKRGQAVWALIQLDQSAKPALPAVTALAKSDSDPGVRASAQEVLRRLSPSDYAQVIGHMNPFSAAVP